MTIRTGWTEPKYPGDMVRRTDLDWPSTGELGVVGIQHYGKNLRVASFCPGRVVELPGDTPKTEPNCEFWTDNPEQADAWFDLYVKRLQEDGWRLR